MFQVLPANPDANNVRLVTSNGLKPELMFKYTGIIYYLLSGYVDNNGIFVFPTYEERLLEGFKPDSLKRFHFVEYCEVVTKVHANKLRELSELAERFVKDDGLPFDYILQAIKNDSKPWLRVPKKRKHDRN